jgi:hypothetical protein
MLLVKLYHRRGLQEVVKAVIGYLIAILPEVLSWAAVQDNLLNNQEG